MIHYDNDEKLRSNNKIFIFLSVIELLLATLTIVLDLLLPTLVIIFLLVLSFILRKQSFSDLNLKTRDIKLNLIFVILGLVVIWNLFELGLLFPILNHITNEKQNLSSFEDLKGNLLYLAILLFLSWTLAGLGEEIVYRGYLQLRIEELFKNENIGFIIAVLLTSFLFGIAHTEQGIIGVTVTFLDAIFFSLLKQYFNKNLWVAVFAHGFSNSIGLIAFFFIGPIYGLW